MALQSLTRRVPLPRHLVESGVALGAASTVVVFFLGVALLALVPFAAIEAYIYDTVGRFWHFNPIVVLKYGAGIPAGYTAARSLDGRAADDRVKTAMLAAVYGWIGVYLGLVCINLVTAPYFPPPVLFSFSYMFLHSMAWIPIFIAGALIGAGAAVVQTL